MATKPKGKKSKLELAKKAAVVSISNDSERLNTGFYDEKDYLKHYIRKKYWERRVTDLQRDVAPLLENGIKYFSFCSRRAFDVRYFIKEGILDFKNRYSKFGFVEYIEKDFSFLENWVLSSNGVLRGSSAHGALAEVAIDASHKHYSRFWGPFPYDVINLDYLGDILKASNPVGMIGHNDFFAVDAIIARQSLLRRQYELWITVRAKSGRFEGVVQHNFRNIIKKNIEDFKDTFGVKFKELYPGTRVDDLEDESLFLTGYLKWLWYVCKKSYSIINRDKLEVIKYKRKSPKDGKEYYLYNIFLRIQPWENLTFPSPVGEAADFCEREYKKGILKCFPNAIDVGDEFKNSDETLKRKIQSELLDLEKEYKETERGWM